jgi:hypothetical protein
MSLQRSERMLFGRVPSVKNRRKLCLHLQINQWLSLSSKKRKTGDSQSTLRRCSSSYQRSFKRNLRRNKWRLEKTKVHRLAFSPHLFAFPKKLVYIQSRWIFQYSVVHTSIVLHKHSKQGKELTIWVKHLYLR